jgi:glyceraldehyde 3-phosphate dehydrogenase
VITKVGINGFGRIGRQVMKTITERHADTLQVVAVNDLVDNETSANLLKYDSNYGRWQGEIRAAEDGIEIDNRLVKVFAEREPGNIPWDSVGAEIVIESTGFFTDAHKAVAHKKNSVKKVVISAPAKNEDITIVLGVNDQLYKPQEHSVISNASCTTNGLAPVVKVLVDNFGFIKGQMTTVHSYTSSQKILDQAGSGDPREMRSAGMNIVPTSTGAARALRLVIPEVEGKLDGLAYRVPTPTVSIVEIVALIERETNAEEVNTTIEQIAKTDMRGILGITHDPVVSMDMKSDERSSIVDGRSTNVVGGDMVKIAAWYDNEWGYACRLSDLCALLAERGMN